MPIGVCITTRHRPELLEDCLRHIQANTLRPARTVVSDDSSDETMIAQTKAVVARFSDVVYVGGPHKGVCANRNHALAYLGDAEYVAFLDDDALVREDYFAVAQAAFDAMPVARRARTIATGLRVSPEGRLTGGRVRLNLRGYFEPTETNEIAGASYSVFPRTFFRDHPWDEQIYFGYEDAELSFRARKAGYDIVNVEQMIVTDGGWMKSTLSGASGELDSYNFAGEAARLYVGVKRFGEIDRDYAKLAVFLGLYFGQVTWSLSKRGSLRRMPELLRLSRVGSLLPVRLPARRSAPRG
jgi:GT2 family glycosyltransferase